MGTRLNVFIAIILALLFLNTLYNSMAVALGLSFPYTTFLHNPNDLFGDYFKVIYSYPGAAQLSIPTDSFLHNYKLHPYGGLSALNQGLISNLGLPPLSTLISILTLKIAKLFNPIYMYVGNIILVFVIMNLFLKSCFKSYFFQIIINILFFVSYPILFAIDRGNIISIINSVCIIIFLIKFYNNNIKISLLFLAVAVNLRPNAVILLIIILLMDKSFLAKIKYILLFIIEAAIIYSVAYIISSNIYPDYTYDNFLRAIEIYRRDYLIGNWGLGYGSSLYGALKFIFRWNSWLEIWAYAFNLLAIICIYYVNSLKKFESYVQTYLVLSIYVLCSSVIADYHLAVFFSPVFLMFMNESDETVNKIQWIILVGSALILSPKNYFFTNGVSYQVLLNPLILSVSIILIIVLKNRDQDFFRI